MVVQWSCRERYIQIVSPSFICILKANKWKELLPSCKMCDYMQRCLMGNVLLMLSVWLTHAVHINRAEAALYALSLVLPRLKCVPASTTLQNSRKIVSCILELLHFLTLNMPTDENGFGQFVMVFSHWST